MEQVKKYLEYCEYRKELDWNTLKAYRIDLRQFFEYCKQDFPDKNTIEDVCNVQEKINISEIKGGKIYNVRASTNIVKENILNNSISYEAEIILNILYESSITNRMEVKEQRIAFTHNINSDKISKDANVNTTIEIDSKDFICMPDNTIDVKINMNFLVSIYVTNNVSIVNNINIEQNSKDTKSSSMVIYFVKEGDTLWKIAKKFKSTIDEIAKVNDIEDVDILHGYPLHPYAVLYPFLHSLRSHSGIETIFGNRFYPIKFSTVNIRIFFFPFCQRLQIHALVRKHILAELTKIQMPEPVRILPYIERIVYIPYQIIRSDCPDIEYRNKTPGISGGNLLQCLLHRILRNIRNAHGIHFPAIPAVRLCRIRTMPGHVTYQIKRGLSLQAVGLIMAVMFHDLFQFSSVVTRMAESLPHILSVRAA